MRQPKNLKDKLKAMRGKTRPCGCDDDHWCNLCLTVPPLSEITLPDGTKTKGYIIVGGSRPDEAGKE